MRAFVGLAFGAAVMLSVVGSLSFLDPSEAGARRCYSIWAEARQMDSGYRHIVHVENDCDYWLQCSVWTDVDPQPPKMLSVGPGMKEQAETNERSEHDDPKAFGTCREK